MCRLALAWVGSVSDCKQENHAINGEVVILKICRFEAIFQQSTTGIKQIHNKQAIWTICYGVSFVQILEKMVHML